MSDTCQTCVRIDCVNEPDLTAYNFQLNAFYSPQYTFVVSCPPGKVCQPGFYPVTITYPPGTFIVTLPDPISPGPNPGPVTIQCCKTQLSTPIPAGATSQQILDLASNLARQCAQQQADCDAASKPPAHNVPIPQPETFANSQQCVPTLTCTPPNVFQFSGSLPPGFSLDGSNNLCIPAGAVGSPSSQAEADTAAAAIARSVADGLIASGAIFCQPPGINWNNLTWGAPIITAGSNPGTAAASAANNSFAASASQAGPAFLAWQGRIIGTMPYTGGPDSSTIQATISIGDGNFAQSETRVLIQSANSGIIASFHSDTVGTYSIPFSVPDSGGSDTLTVTVTASADAGLGNASVAFSGDIIPAF